MDFNHFQQAVVPTKSSAGDITARFYFSTMDPENNLQDLVRCNSCDTPLQRVYCGIHLCEKCKNKQLLDESQGHEVVQRAVSMKNNSHNVNPVGTILENSKDQKDNLHKNTQILETITKHKAYMLREVDNIFKKLESDMFEIDSKNLTLLDRQENETKRSISGITHSIGDMNELLTSNGDNIVSAYKSRNDELKTLSPKRIDSLPKYNPPKINKKLRIEQVGSLSAVLSTTEEDVYARDSSNVESSALEKSLMKEPQIIAIVNIKYVSLHCVSCLSNEVLSTCYFFKKIIRFYNLQGDPVKSIKTNSGNIPWDMAVTNEGNLLYTDYGERTVNIIKNEEIERLITLSEWIPLNVCCTLSNDLLIVVVSDDNKQTKVVRYVGSTEKQSIQYSEVKKPLYSSGNYCKYICENRNEDICVADRGACKIVVVNRGGNFRFTYIGNPYTSHMPFYPTGITTDSQSQILTADCNNHRIHILDQDGEFLRYVENCDLYFPYDVCVDTSDNLFVVEWSIGKVKKIKYLMP